jgi:microcystin-dependent protein
MSQPYAGEIRLFAFWRIPNGWLACDGSLQSISNYEILYTLIGTVYGGDGVTTFGLPDLRGRIPVHQGQGTGLTNRPLGQGFGTETVTLTVQQMAAHTHGFLATTTAATTDTPGPALLPGTSSVSPYISNLTGANPVTLASTTTTMTGGSQPHDNMMPTLALSYCIAAFGVFPSPP